MKIFLTSTLAIFIVTTLAGQTNPVIVPGNISLPKDTVLKNQLLSGLNGFLSQKEGTNNKNTFVLKEDLLETSDLLDEMKEIEKSNKQKDDYFYKAYLTSVNRLRDSGFIVQLAYIGISEGVPMLRANFTLLARKIGAQFYFHSPLKQNTIAWKTAKFGKTSVYYKNTINTSKAKGYFKLTDEFDKKLNSPIVCTKFYCCDNFQESLKLLGVDYKSDYSGRSYSSTSENENDTSLFLDGALTSDFTDFDPHDLWHSRLHNVLSLKIINKPVDEGTAYLYGGSWGFTWKQILEKFKTYAAENPNADWLALYNESKNFDPHGKYPLNVDFVINALLVQKIEKEKDFSPVIELLSCGKQEKDNENFFSALEKITGISKSDFSSTVWTLIKS